jgi:hypothetical protein
VLAGLLSVALVAASCQGPSHRERVQQIAAIFGYDPASTIAEVDRCWDVFAHCGQFLYFRTDQTSEDIEGKIDALGWTLLNKVEVDGYEIFTNINLGTRSRMRIDGSDGIEERSKLPRLRGDRWRLSDAQGRTWTITHFPLADRPNSIELDGSPLQQNVVSVVYQTR